MYLITMRILRRQPSKLPSAEMPGIEFQRLPFVRRRRLRSCRNGRGGLEGIILLGMIAGDEDEAAGNLEAGGVHLGNSELLVRSRS